MRRDLSWPLVLFCIFVSGITGLGFKTLWIRGLSLLLGNTSYALACVISIYVLGLTAGGLFISRSLKSRKILALLEKKEILIYGCLELVTGVISLLITWLIFFYQEPLAGFLITSEEFGLSALGSHSLIAFILLFIPSFFSGMLIPVLACAAGTGLRVERLYSFQLLGGAISFLIVGFLLVPAFGFWVSAQILLALSWMIFWLATVLHYKANLAEKSVIKDRGPALNFGSTRAVLWISTFTGYLFFSSEILWERNLRLLLGDRAYNTYIVLFLIFMAMALAAICVRRIAARLSLVHFFFLLTSALTLTHMISLIFKERAAQVYSGATISISSVIAYSMLGILIPAFLLSLIFPELLYYLRTKHQFGVIRGRLVALALGVNAFGGAIALLVTTYVLLPRMGSLGLLHFNLFLFLIFSALIVWTQSKSFTRLFYLGVYSLSALAIYQIKDVRFLIAEPSAVINQKEDGFGHFTLLNRGDQKLEMYLDNYRIVAPTDRVGLKEYQSRVGFLPLSFRPDLKTALVLGLGYGATPGALLQLPLTKIDVVELSQSVIDAAPNFSHLNNEFWKDSRVTVIQDDARRFLRRTDQKYDLIIATLLSPYTSAGTPFYSRQFYELVKSKLTPNGVFVQPIWGPQSVEIAHTLKRAFGHLQATKGYTYSIVAMGSAEDFGTPKRPDWLNDRMWQLGQRELQYLLRKPPQFEIDDLHPKLEYAGQREFGFFWLYPSFYKFKM